MTPDITIKYDRDSCVLYLHKGEPKPAEGGLEVDGVLYRRDADGKLIGVTLVYYTPRDMDSDANVANAIAALLEE